MQKRSVNILGHATSITLEDAFWQALKSIAESEGLSINGLVTKIDAQRQEGSNLSSALRVYVLKYYQDT